LVSLKISKFCSKQLRWLFVPREHIKINAKSSEILYTVILNGFLNGKPLLLWAYIYKRNFWGYIFGKN
ncbi:hypothetical protein AAULR_26511, partial [Lacticaseibacillus rhamnosus MTCC 5462]